MAFFQPHIRLFCPQSSWSWLFSWHCPCDCGIRPGPHHVAGKKQQSCWRVLWVPKGHKWACWKGRKPTAWHLMPPDKHLGKQGCNLRFPDHEIFDPHKNRSVSRSTFALQFLFMFNCISSTSLFFVTLLFVTYLLLFIILPVVLYSRSFILLDYFEFASINIIPHDCAIFCLGMGSKSLLQSYRH
jgi:hypothetical protein